MTALHPLVRALRGVDLSSPTSQEVNEVFEAAAQGGITPVERRLLTQALDQYGAGWSNAARSAWASRLQEATGASVGSTPSSSGPAPEDLSARMKTVWMPGYGDEIQDVYVADMARLAPTLGFHIVLEVPAWASMLGVAAGLVNSTGVPVESLDQIIDVVRSPEYASVWGEDNKILTNGNDPAKPVKVLVPPDVSSADLSRAEAFTADEGYHLFREGFQGAVTERDEDEAAVGVAKSLGHVHQRTKTYIEGGNLLPGTTSDGEAYAMVGRDTVVISAFHLDREGEFESGDVAAKVAELQAEGRMPSALVEATAKKLLRVKQWTSWSAPASVNSALRAEARDFLAKLELTHELLAKDLDLPKDRVVVVTQPEFHIDMHMRPLAPGEVLIQHPARCIELLDEALLDPGAKAWEKSELRAMRANAVAELEELGPVYDQIVSEVQAAGLIPVLAPGVFANQNRQANFLNAVPGTTAADETYFLTNASSLKPLERAFERFMKDLGVDRVEFLGGAWGGRYSLSASEYSLELSGGLDCREVNHAGKHTPKMDLTAALAGWA